MGSDFLASGLTLSMPKVTHQKGREQRINWIMTLIFMLTLTVGILNAIL